MKFSVRNYRRVERADVAGDRIIVVAGRNQQGKTSLLQGVALCVTGLGVPSTHFKKQAGELVHRGAESGHVEADFGGATQRVSYPKAEAFGEGALPTVSPVAAGLVDPTALKPDDLAKLLARVIPDAEPTLADLTAAFADLSVPEKIAESVWNMIEAQGWDAALAKAAETGASFKGGWEQVTGKKWGVKAGAEWRPDGWRDELLAEPIEALREKREDLAEALERAIGDAAVDEHEVKRLEALAGDVDERAKFVEEAQKWIDHWTSELDKLRKERNEAGDLPEQGDMPCPSCGTLLGWQRVDQGVRQLIVAEHINEKDRKALMSRIAKLDGSIVDASQKVAQFKTNLENATRAHIEAVRAAEQLAELRQKAGGKGTQADVEAAKAALAQAVADIAAIETYAAARKIHTNIVNNTALREVLDAGGLRKTVLARAVKDFNAAHLAPVWQAAKWPETAIEPDLTVSHDGYPLRNVEGSGLWMARLVLQVAIARAEGSPLVIVDGADILDEKGADNAGNRNRMFTMLNHVRLTALVGMTVAEPAKIEAMLKIPVVSAYWIADGRTQPLGEALAEREAA